VEQAITKKRTRRTHSAQFKAKIALLALRGDTLRQAFTRTERRKQRASDGTLVIEARRFEVPNRYNRDRRDPAGEVSRGSRGARCSSSTKARRCSSRC
jgi:transposase-like protein